MATEIKKYLDLEGLQHLIEKLNNEKRIVKHPTDAAASASPVRVGRDANGHVVLGDALAKVADTGSYDDLLDKPTIGTGTLTIQANGATKGTFNANAENDTTINITLGDLGVDSALHFRGVFTATSEVTNPQNGDVCLVGSTEHIYSDGTWYELGDEASHALKSITISGDGTYILGGGDLSQDRTLSHKTYTAASAAAVKIGRDSGGHVVIGGALGTVAAGEHDHDVTSSIPANTFLTSASGSTTKISLDKTNDTFIKSYSGVTGNLVTTKITGTNGTVTASKATAGTAKDVAKAGTAVVYGKANVGSAVSVATRASSQTTVGDANVGSEITITGVSGSTTASKATKGAAVNVATVDEAVTVATIAETSTTVGNANLGDEISIIGVSGSTTASKAKAGTAVSVAKVGSAVTYGTADAGTAVSGIAKVGSQITYGGANVGSEISILGIDGETTASKAKAGTAVSVATTDTAKTVATLTNANLVVGNANVGASATVATGVKSHTVSNSVSQNAYNADYVEADECLVLTPATVTVTSTPSLTLNTTSVTSAASASTKLSSAIGTTSVTPAKANGTITPYTFSDVTVPVAANAATSFNPAVASSDKAYVCADGTGVSITPAVKSTKTLTPATSNGTITPWTFEDVTVPKAASAATVFNAAVASSTEIYGVGSTVDITPAKANGSIDTYSFADITVPKAAAATKFNPAVSSSTKIYGVGGVTDITPAVAAPNTQTIVPAVSNGTITPYSFADVTAAAQGSEITVATGTINTEGTGDSLLTGLGTATTASALTTAAIKSGTTGDVTVVTEVKSGKNTAAVSISGTAATAGEHTHEVQ